MIIQYGGVKFKFDAHNEEKLQLFYDACMIIDSSAEVCTKKLKSWNINNKKELYDFVEKNPQKIFDYFCTDHISLFLSVHKEMNKTDFALFFYVSLCLRFIFPILPGAMFIAHKVNENQGANKITISDEDASEWFLKHLYKAYQELQEAPTPAQEETEAPTPAQEETEAPTPAQEETEVIENTSIISLDFLDVLEKINVSEKTIRIAEFLARSFDYRMLEFQKDNQITREKKNELIQNGTWAITSEYCEPIVFTPRELAKNLYPNEYYKNGQRKTITRTLKEFAELHNATITRNVIDETGKMVKRVTPILTIEYDFIEATVDEIIKEFKQNPAEFLEKRDDALDYLQNIRVFASVPMIANQYTQVAGGETWLNYIFKEKSEDKTKGARRLSRYNVPEISADLILKVEEMSQRVQRSARAQIELLKGVAVTTGKVYGKQYEFKPKERKFCSLMQTTQEKPKKRGRKKKDPNAPNP